MKRNQNFISTQFSSMTWYGPLVVFFPMLDLILGVILFRLGVPADSGGLCEPKTPHLP